jgi:hypothetical protein
MSVSTATGWRRALSYADDLLLVVVVAAGGVWGYHRIEGPSDDPPPAAVASHTPSEAERLLASLPVKGRAPKTAYDRKAFGVGSIDFDRNGCGYRDDALRRDLTDVATRPGTHDCVVTSGTLADPYTGMTIDFVKGDTRIEIDHVVALADAWQKGAQQLDADMLVRFGNDPRNLLAVSRQANRQKRDSDAASWLPANKAFRCTYVTRQIEVKAAYDLWVTKAEHDEMARILRTCP